MIRKLKLLIILAGFCAACGGPPDATEETESALTPAQVWTSETPAMFTSDPYQCAGAAWHVRQPIAQWYGFGSWGSWWYTTELAGNSGLNLARNEIQIQCPVAAMQNMSTYLRNSTALLCQVYAHVAGSGWTWSAQVTVPATGLGYSARGYMGYSAGRWNVTMWLPNYTTQLGWWGTGYGLSACLGPDNT